MYFLEQIKKQFIAQLASYNVEGGVDTSDGVDTQNTTTEGPDAEAIGIDAHDTASAMSKRVDEFSQQIEELGNDGVEQILEGAEGQELTDFLVYSESEETVAREALGGGDEVTKDEIQEYILTDRLQSLNENTIKVEGEDEGIIEAVFIEKIANENGISPETLSSLKALGIDGANSWDSENTAENLKALAESIREIEGELKERGIEIPDSETERIALYDYLMQTDPDLEGPLDEDAVAELGITEVGPDGELRINPNTPGYTEMPNGAVVGPPGSPSSYNGNVYAGRPNEISPNAGHITYDSLTEFTGGGNLSESQKSQVNNPENIPLIESRFPEQWYDIAIEFCNTEGNINPDKPIALASCPSLTALVSYPGQPPKIEESPIAIGRNGYGPNVVADHDRNSGGTGDRRTQTGRVQHFQSVTIAGEGELAGGRTMTGAIIRSPEGEDRGGRWWHGGRDGRFPGHNSHGCVVAPDDFMIRLAEAVNRHGGGYGFQSEQATSEVSASARTETPTS